MRNRACGSNTEKIADAPIGTLDVIVAPPEARAPPPSVCRKTDAPGASTMLNVLAVSRPTMVTGKEVPSSCVRVRTTFAVELEMLKSRNVVRKLPSEKVPFATWARLKDVSVEAAETTGREVYDSTFGVWFCRSGSAAIATVLVATTVPRKFVLAGKSCPGPATKTAR